MCVLFLIVTAVQSFKAFNLYTKKCLCCTQTKTLSQEDCTLPGINLLLEWTANNQLRNYKARECVQVATDGVTLSVGGCSDNDSVPWTCEGSFIRSKYGYLSWNIEQNRAEITSAMKKPEGQWVIYNSDNNICEYAQHVVSTTHIPFTQPTSKFVQRKSGKLYNKTKV